jgi:hypothetical protein
MELEIGMRRGHRKNLAEASIKFFIKELGLGRSRYSLTVTTDKTLRKEENAFGIVFRVGKRDLVMILDSRMQYKDMVETIAHEMVHVKQIARGTLNTVIKRGRMYQTWKGKRADNIAYHRRPWELEAFRRERELTNNFVYDFLEKIK